MKMSQIGSRGFRYLDFARLWYQCTVKGVLGLAFAGFRFAASSNVFLSHFLHGVGGSLAQVNGGLIGSIH